MAFLLCCLPCLAAGYGVNKASNAVSSIGGDKKPKEPSPGLGLFDEAKLKYKVSIDGGCELCCFQLLLGRACVQNSVAQTEVRSETAMWVTDCTQCNLQLNFIACRAVP